MNVPFQWSPFGKNTDVTAITALASQTAEMTKMVDAGLKKR